MEMFSKHQLHSTYRKGDSLTRNLRGKLVVSVVTEFIGVPQEAEVNTTVEVL